MRGTCNFRALQAAEDDGEIISLQMAMRAPTYLEAMAHVREAFDSACKRRAYEAKLAQGQPTEASRVA